MNKHRLCRLWIVIVSVLCLSSSLFAQEDYNPDPCVPDCPDDNFATPYIVSNITLPNGCEVDVTWTYRYASCVDNYDLAILNIETGLWSIRSVHPI